MKPIVAAAVIVLSGCIAEKPPASRALEPRVELQRPAPMVIEAPVAVAEKPDPQKQLAERVKHALETEARIHAAAIDVTAQQGGVVTLWGTADSEDERLRAARVAYRVYGVNAVTNRIQIVKGS